MRALLFLISSLLLVSGSYSQHYAIDRYFPIADSVSTYPPAGQKLTILCQKKIDRYYVSFVGMETEAKAIIAVVTPKQFTEPDSIALSVAFSGYHPSTGKVPTWGYIFDRNEDGKIDYMALVSGAAAFKGSDFPAQYPTRNQYFTQPQLEYFVAHCKLIFNHWADDNYDGRLDGVVHVDMDSARDWVERRLVVRSKGYNRAFDDVWGFYETTSEEPQPVSFTSDTIPFHSPGKPNDSMTWKKIDEKSGILYLLNRAVEACGFTAGKFVHPERKER